MVIDQTIRIPFEHAWRRIATISTVVTALCLTLIGCTSDKEGVPPQAPNPEGSKTEKPQSPVRVEPILTSRSFGSVDAGSSTSPNGARRPKMIFDVFGESLPSRCERIPVLDIQFQPKCRVKVPYRSGHSLDLQSAAAECEEYWSSNLRYRKPDLMVFSNSKIQSCQYALEKPEGRSDAGNGICLTSVVQLYDCGGNVRFK